MSQPVVLPAADWALGTFQRASGPAFAGLVVLDRVLDVSALALLGRADASTRDLLEQWDTVAPQLRELVGPPNADWLPLAALEVAAPVEPRQIIQAGANYRTHVMDLAVKHHDYRDGKSEDEVRAESAAQLDRRATNGVPYFFTGLVSAITGPYATVTLPAYSDQHDWELELAVVIGRRAFHVSRPDALEHVAGYTIANDLTTRDRVFPKDGSAIGSDWFRSKNAPGFLPLGPFLVPREFVTDPNDLQVTLALNGDVMQDESTKDMIFDVATLVASASETAVLLPGDVLLTGSPAGNGLHHGRLLRHGDLMTGGISGLGEQRTPCVAETP